MQCKVVVEAYIQGCEAYISGRGSSSEPNGGLVDLPAYSGPHGFRLAPPWVGGGAGIQVPPPVPVSVFFALRDGMRLAFFELALELALVVCGLTLDSFLRSLDVIVG